MSRLCYGGFALRLRQDLRARRLTLRFSPERGDFTLTVPAGCGQGEALRFLDAQRPWMAARLEQAPWRPAYLPGERHLLWGRYETLGAGVLPAGQAALEGVRARELQALVEAELPLWCARMGVRPARVTVRDMTSRWGICQAHGGRITLSLRLARLPKAYVPYVLAHELNHLRHPDHSPAFYADMARFFPAWAQLRQAMAREPLQPLPPLPHPGPAQGIG